MRRPKMATALRDLIPSNATRQSVSTRSGSFLMVAEGEPGYLLSIIARQGDP